MKIALTAASLMSSLSLYGSPALAQTTDYFCYIVQPNGRLVDLTEFCGGYEEISTAVGSGMSPNNTSSPATPNSISAAQGDLPMNCNFSDPQVVDNTTSLRVSYDFSCLALDDVQASDITLELAIADDAVSFGLPVIQAMPPLAAGATHNSSVTFNSVGRPTGETVVFELSYVVQERPL
ncbi:hypothetical protein PN498_24855 [Oscillatoria sp. CS-180]|uniref:hypothetical protein n=1 Tax=Oscillatoria sp. CS-180 TaxID=3021720 RepID=UPI00232AEE3E|nr:hypothetical protein [Oscillatoria sp. CS-180]MDB9529246.1 hypothetical protein [Oscillatoria sp. CS-180]